MSPWCRSFVVSALMLAAAGSAQAGTEVDGDADGFCISGPDSDADGDCDELDAVGLGDCDDANPAANPDRTERCNNAVDEDCTGGPGHDGVDADGDGEGPDGIGCDGADCDDGDATLNINDVDGDGFDTCEGSLADCDDADAAVNGVAAEVCGDAVDNDCSGGADDLDVDGDGAVAEGCGGLDCDDANGAISPEANESGATCRDVVDNDCDTTVDGMDEDCWKAPKANAGADQQDFFLGGTLVIALDGSASSDENPDDTLAYTWVLDTPADAYPGATLTLHRGDTNIAYLSFSAAPGGELQQWAYDLHLEISDGHLMSDSTTPESRVRVVITRPERVAETACGIGASGPMAAWLAMPLIALVSRRRNRAAR